MALVIPTEPIGSIPRPLKLIEARSALGNSHPDIEALDEYTSLPLKQTVISPSASSLMYPADGLPGYSGDEFLDALLNEHETEICRCLRRGAHKVQIDFTEGRLAQKIDLSAVFLHSFIDLNNMALERFSLPIVNILKYTPVVAPIALRRAVRT